MLLQLCVFADRAQKQGNYAVVKSVPSPHFCIMHSWECVYMYVCTSLHVLLCIYRYLSDQTLQWIYTASSDTRWPQFLWLLAERLLVSLIIISLDCLVL